MRQSTISAPTLLLGDDAKVQWSVAGGKGDLFALIRIDKQDTDDAPWDATPLLSVAAYDPDVLDAAAATLVEAAANLRVEQHNRVALAGYTRDVA